jgi:hypothetical protein
VIFQDLSVVKKGKFWSVKLAVLEDLYSYAYPFSFPKYFLLYTDVYDMEVKFEFLISISSVSLEKTFFVKNILEKCSIYYRNRAKVKRLRMNGFSVLIEENIIESDLELIDKTRSSLIINDENLTPLLIGKK